mmetsp:Transcript_42964/g.78087  ORF Transcript_42964/g.78087 Transcript_42964/m.78087 type:complete len:205 (+) Transcript_42964:1018-1632(+)
MTLGADRTCSAGQGAPDSLLPCSAVCVIELIALARTVSFGEPGLSAPLSAVRLVGRECTGTRELCMIGVVGALFSSSEAIESEVPGSLARSFVRCLKAYASSLRMAWNCLLCGLWNCGGNRGCSLLLLASWNFCATLAALAFAPGVLRLARGHLRSPYLCSSWDLRCGSDVDVPGLRCVGTPTSSMTSKPTLEAHVVQLGAVLT